ncbi:tripartite tricarboxylate transporter substrate binding protein [Allopusillimonas soli]|uniref:Tripartite tricarboxylate transporter substrate binding protein n=1 Tax=Allopusillimonas soli TaxID=659016 RepID=A0A853FKT3_9BURK|nr:tripartite tricarboxylate transporter substrate binding protein [Allopusillimonas soli]NYT38981.1 tripartite tricarboxylate transporter substrate binding protein [Allopusillimonas soli]TEA69575.1 tripartite tricarboxylate transporter substrate binding protein [Allopusillimonas soli]
MTYSPWRIASRLAAVACMAIALPAFAAGQYPDRPITIVVPYSPGGGVDIVTRLVTSHMSEALGQPFVVDNRPGAGTNIGMSYAAHAKPDGYTLYTASNTLATNKALYSKLNFDPATAFAPVGKIGEAPLVVVVNEDSPFKTLKDLVDYGRKHPKDLTFGTAGVGSSGHMASELLLRSGHFKALHVPYKGGAPAITDLLGGRISFMAINPLEVISHIKAGKLRALAVLNTDGTPLLPDLPTAKAQGLGDLEATVWWGIVAPAGTPAAVVQKLNASLDAALKNADVQARLAQLGAKEQPGTPAQFQAFVSRERDKLTQVIKEAHIKAD